MSSDELLEAILDRLGVVTLRVLGQGLMATRGDALFRLRSGFETRADEGDEEPILSRLQFSVALNFLGFDKQLLRRLEHSETFPCPQVAKTVRGSHEGSGRVRRSRASVLGVCRRTDIAAPVFPGREHPDLCDCIELGWLDDVEPADVDHSVRLSLMLETAVVV